MCSLCILKEYLVLSTDKSKQQWDEKAQDDGRHGGEGMHVVVMDLKQYFAARA